MIFSNLEEWRLGSPPGLETGLNDALYPYKCRTMPVPIRNFAPNWRVENPSVKAQVGLESRLTGPRVHLARGTPALGHAIFPIPFFEQPPRPPSTTIPQPHKLAP